MLAEMGPEIEETTDPFVGMRDFLARRPRTDWSGWTATVATATVGDVTFTINDLRVSFDGDAATSLTFDLSHLTQTEE